MRFEPIGATLADHLAPGGKLADAGETLRFLGAELARLDAAGVSPAATAALRAARTDLVTSLAIVDAAEPHLMAHSCDGHCAHTISVGPVWMMADGRWISTCRHCGDGTDRDDDPAPDLCAMCAKAGRTGKTRHLT